jgi:hypothetical protein
MIRRRVSILGELMTVHAARQWPIVTHTHPSMGAKKFQINHRKQTIKHRDVGDGCDRRRRGWSFSNPSFGMGGEVSTPMSRIRDGPLFKRERLPTAKRRFYFPRSNLASH